jgi:hypothetical protein
MIAATSRVAANSAAIRSAAVPSWSAARDRFVVTAPARGSSVLRTVHTSSSSFSASPAPAAAPVTLSSRNERDRLLCARAGHHAARRRPLAGLPTPWSASCCRHREHRRRLGSTVTNGGATGASRTTCHATTWKPSPPCSPKPWRVFARTAQRSGSHGIRSRGRGRHRRTGRQRPMSFNMPGHLSFHGAAASNAAAARITAGSSRWRPMICKPTGRPSSVHPAGTLAAGCPVKLRG